MSAFKVGQKVTIRPAYRMPDRIGGQPQSTADSMVGDWFVLEVCDDGDLGLARSADRWAPEFWLTASRVVS